jgi:hypothetical protein
LALIVVYIIFLYTGTFTVLRNFALNGGFGDIYSFGGVFLRVQVHGNALLVVAFMLSVMKRQKIGALNVWLFAGVFVAGNFAFLLGTALFLAYYFFRKTYESKKMWYINIIPFLLFTVTICMFLYPYVKRQFEQKSQYSNIVRIEQAEVLLSGTIIRGNGIGNSITAKTSNRNYEGALYYELQSFYIINQIGVIGYLIFMFSTIYTFYYLAKNKKMLIVYFIYLFYSFWNPYCFDSTHMFAVILLLNECNSCCEQRTIYAKHQDKRIEYAI